MAENSTSTLDSMKIGLKIDEKPKGRTMVSVPERKAIISKFKKGLSVGEIAKEENRSNSTVSRIVRNADKTKISESLISISQRDLKSLTMDLVSLDHSIWMKPFDEWIQELGDITRNAKKIKERNEW